MMDAAVDFTPPNTSPPIIDVWSRTAPKYRRRAVLMLLVLALLFGGLCCFTFWLRTGVIWPWGSEEFAEVMERSFRPSGTDQVTLVDFLSAPISVKEVPVHGVIMGLLFASLSSIPILVSILYRFPASIVFSAMVMFLAAMPWLGITVLGGCWLSTLPRFRYSFRYASALMGLIPVAGYFVMASWEPAGARSRSVENLALLYAPWVLALLCSCVICAVALFVAKLINYRPGGISPVLAILFAIPVILFHTRVGRDELEYRILERQIGPGSRRFFLTEDIGAAAEREASQAWGFTPQTSYDELKRTILARRIAEVMEDAENDRERASAICDSFIERFPKSSNVPYVLFLKGQARDERLNRNKLLTHYRAEHRTDNPNVASLGTWQTLLEQFPNHELTAMAMYKLAILQARQGRFDDALRLLEQLAQKFDPAIATTQPNQTDRASLFRRSRPTDKLGMQMDWVLGNSRRLAEQIRSCRNDAPGVAVEAGSTAQVHPLSLMLCMDETHPLYEVNLRRIVTDFPASQSAGYAAIRLVATEPAISRRISKLRAAAEALSGKPAGAEAAYLLADVLQEDSVLDEAQAVYGELIKGYPDSYWAGQAKQRLASLTLAERPAS